MVFVDFFNILVENGMYYLGVADFVRPLWTVPAYQLVGDMVEAIMRQLLIYDWITDTVVDTIDGLVYNLLYISFGGQSNFANASLFTLILVYGLAYIVIIHLVLYVLKLLDYILFVS